MKRILWIIGRYNIEFRLNWFEYFILKRVYNKRKYSISQNKLVGTEFDAVLVDEFCTL